MDRLSDDRLGEVLTYVEDLRSRAALAATSKRLRKLVRRREWGLTDVKVRLRVNDPPVALTKRGAFNVLLDAYLVPAVLTLVAHISVLEIKKKLDLIEASVVVAEIRKKGIPVDRIAILPSGAEDKGRLLSDVLQPVRGKLPAPETLAIYHSFSIDALPLSNGFGALRRLELGSQLHVPDLDTLVFPESLAELRLAATMESPTSAITFLPLLSRLTSLTLLQIEAVVFSLDNENTFTTFVKQIGKEHMPRLATLEFTDCQFLQNYVPRKAGQASFSAVKRLAFVDRKGAFRRNHGLVRILCMEISRDSPLLVIDLDLDELELFWRQSSAPLAARKIRLDLGICQRTDKRRLSYPRPPPELSPLLVNLILRRISDPYLAEFLFRHSAFPALAKISFLACQLSQRCLELLAAQCPALESLVVVEDEKPCPLKDLVRPLVEAMPKRRSAFLSVHCDFATSFEAVVLLPAAKLDLKRLKLRSASQAHLSGQLTRKTLSLWCPRTRRTTAFHNFLPKGVDTSL